MAEIRVQVYSLGDFKATMDAKGVVRSRAEWQRRGRAGQLGQKIGTEWVFTSDDVLKALESGMQES